jgi:CHAT domain-containing protein
MGRDKASEHVAKSLGVAETLLRAGIANVLGTYWPVGDDAAKEFSAQFYPALLDGVTLGEAIQRGRKAVIEGAKSIDWADYVFYGSHDFMLKVSTQ